MPFGSALPLQSEPSLPHLFLRYLALTAFGAASLYGVLNFPGKNLRSPRYLTRPECRFWSPWRIANDAEWTAEGLVYRRRILTWWGVTAALAFLFAALW
jgi:hypothetical protein